MPKLTFQSGSLQLDGDGSESASWISPRGFIDSSNCQSFEGILERCLEANPRFLLLDFSQVNYINSSGISAVIRSHGKCRERDGTLALVAVPKAVGLTMHLLGVTSLIPFFKDQPAALASFLERSRSPKPASEPGGAVATAAPDPGQQRIVVPLRKRRHPLIGANLVLLTPKLSRLVRILNLRYENHAGSGRLHVFQDAEKASAALDGLKPDLVILDSRLDPTGEFVNRLKMHPERSLISVLKLYSRNGGHAKEDWDFKIWENDYLEDPFEVQELFSLAEAELIRVPKDRRVFQQQVRYEFRTTPDNLDRANKLNELVLRRCFRSEEDRTALYAAIKEGLDNAAIHGNRWRAESTIDVNLLIDRSKVTVIVEDQGEGFDYEYYLSRLDDREAFEKARKRILEEGQRGGLGILLMRRCTDRLAYAGNGNVLRLEKNLP